jgi:hypothetical protein
MISVAKEEYIVVSSFIDKFTKVRYPAGSTYEAGKERFEELHKMGFLEEKVEEANPLGDLLKKNADEVIASINEGTSKEDLEELHRLELEGKNRKTVKEHIESLRG